MELLILLIVTCNSLISAQIQQAWVAKYNYGIPNGNHQGLKLALDSSGNAYVLGVSANPNMNVGYVVVKYAQDGNQVWAARFDSTNFPAAAPTGFALDSSNDVVVTGSAVTVKFDGNGNQLWTAPYSAQAIAIDLGHNVYITGISDKFTTMKLNALGSNLWVANWSYFQTRGVSQVVAVDSSSNVYVSGEEDVTSTPTIYPMVAALKYDSNGNQLWEMDINVGPVGETQAVGLVLDKLNNMYLEFNMPQGGGQEGYQTCKLNDDGTAVWFAGNPTRNGSSLSVALALDGTGDAIVTGANAYEVYPNNRYGTYKIDTSGNYVWSNVYPAVVTGNSQSTSIAVDSANGVYVTGFSPSLGSNATSDIVTIKYDSNGNQVWVQRYDGPGHGNDAGNAIAVDNSGNVYVAGYETETNGFTSMILIKYSPVTIQKQSNGSVILHAYGSPGETFDIQASTNLQTWQDLGDVTADTNGLAQFDDTNAAEFTSRFYYTIPQ
jgi:hypothetical protein